MNRKAFNVLGDAVPPAFGMGVAGLTARARLGAAESIARQLRCQHELLVPERTGGGDPARLNTMVIGSTHVRPLGDEVLRAATAEVLEVLARSLHEHGNLTKRMQEKGWRELRDGELGVPGLRTLYGYVGPNWSGQRPAGTGPRRVTVRVGVCLAADATFAPYARGVLDAIEIRPSSLRIDLRSAANAIWSWAIDHPALARCLTIAHTNVDGKTTMAYPSFTTLLRRVISDHLELALDDESRTEQIDSASKKLGSVATQAVAEAATPGTTYDGAVYKPMVALLSGTHPDWLPEEAETEAIEVFAGGAAPLVLQGLTGLGDPEEIAANLESLAQALRTAKVTNDKHA